jgi:flagellar motor protein MotB
MIEGARAGRRGRSLFPVNVWPPMVDALTLALAAFVLLMVVAAAAQRAVLSRLRQRDAEVQRLRDEKARVERRLRALAAPGTIEVDEGRVILQGEVLFASGSDELSAAGRHFVVELARPLGQLLRAEPDQTVLVGGHTDDRPIQNRRFDSNWELSAARATAVARALVGAGLPPAQVAAAGFGEYHPRADNHDESGRRRNRRIEVQVVPIHSVSSTVTAGSSPVQP